MRTSQFNVARGPAGRATPELAVDHNFHGSREKEMFCSCGGQVRLDVEVGLLQLSLWRTTNVNRESTQKKLTAAYLHISYLRAEPSKPILIWRLTSPE